MSRVLARAFACAACLLAVLAVTASSALALPSYGDPGADNGAVNTLTGQIELVLSAQSVQVAESGTTGTVMVRLAQRPDHIVTVTPLADVPAATPDRQVRAAPATLALEFGPDTWDQPRAVLISAIDDEVVEASPHIAHVTLAVVGSDAQLLASAPVEVRIDDNDRPSVVVNDADGSTHVGEGAESDALDIRLGTRPTANVTVRLELGRQLVASAPELVFTPQNWNAMQSVRIGASEDLDVEGVHTDAIRFALTSADAGYGSGVATPAAIAVTITDDDLAGITLTHTDTDTRVREGGRADAYSVQLTARPTSTVRVAIDAGEDLTASPKQLEFTPDSWKVAQNVNLVAVDDEEEETHLEKITVYHAIDGDTLWKAVKPPTLMVEVTDNDDAVGDDGTVVGDDGIGVDGEETSERQRSIRASDLVDMGISADDMAPNAQPASGSAGGAPAASGSGRIVLPELATGARAGDGAGGDAATPTVGIGGGRSGTRGGGSGEPRRVEAQPRNLEEWYSRHWKKTVPATGAAALGMGGLLFSLMSDGGGGIIRRRLF
jgi:hypothetical protein